MPVEKAILWGIVLLALIVLLVVWLVRSRAVNRDDPLQVRLADHMRTYFQSSGSAEEGDRMVESLRRELKQRQVPRTEWDFRLSAAMDLAGKKEASQTPVDLASAEIFVSLIKRLGSPT
jgi:hypothetical protein